MTKYVVILNQLTVLIDLLQWLWRNELIKTAHVAFCTLRCFIHKPAALFMTYCKISLMSVISRDTPTPSYIPTCRNKINFDKLLHACFLILFYGRASVHIRKFSACKGNFTWSVHLWVVPIDYADERFPLHRSSWFLSIFYCPHCLNFIGTQLIGVDTGS